ncbi:MAG: hypothetical protein E6J20_19000, partial [Chloroflexi bacterium]
MTDREPSQVDEQEVYSPELVLIAPELRAASLERLALAEAAVRERREAERAAGEVVSREELREKTLTGVRWLGGFRAISIPLSFASTVVLARLIDPAAFGRAAIA